MAKRNTPSKTIVAEALEAPAQATLTIVIANEEKGKEPFTFAVPGDIEEELRTAQTEMGKAYGHLRKLASRIGEIFAAPECFENPKGPEGKALMDLLKRTNPRYVKADSLFRKMGEQELKTDAERLQFAGIKAERADALQVIMNAKQRLRGYWLDTLKTDAEEKQREAKSIRTMAEEFCGRMDRRANSTTAPVADKGLAAALRDVVRLTLANREAVDALLMAQALATSVAAKRQHPEKKPGEVTIVKPSEVPAIA